MIYWRAIVAALGAIGLTNSLVITCPGTKDSDGCDCQQTESGVTCPAGYYCPMYSNETLADIQNTYLKDGCVVRPDGELQCPCTPGFFCPENTLSPSYCCEGYQCETPAAIEVCPAGKFCKVGMVEGIDCGSKSDCPEGSTYQSSSGFLVALIIIMAALWLLFTIKYFIHSKVMEHQKSRVAIEKELSEEASRRLSCKVTPEPSSGGIAAFEVGRDNDESRTSPVSSPYSPSKQDYHITFENVGLTLPSGLSIMKGVTGEFLPRRTCAIMGPSGAGKTTIINLVTGKATKTEGVIHVNGEPVNDLSKWKKLVGFVPQEDVMIRQLTVRDNIVFSARYRLPASMTFSEKNDVVNQTLVALGIDHVQHSVVGDERERGVSGGQRKRVNIGIELAALPSVLFLDEPTSGLDSTSSATLTKQLKTIAVEQNVTIAAVIHQPSIQTFFEFDDLLLLGKGGQVIFQGPVKDAPAYFASIGFEMGEMMNPADFYLDVANGAVSRQGDSSFEPAHLFRFWENKKAGRDINFNPEEEEAVVAANADPADVEIDAVLNPRMNLAGIYRFAVLFLMWMWSVILSIFEHICEIITDFIESFTKKDEIRETTGFIGQLGICMHRAFKQKYRYYGAFAGQMLIHLSVAIVVSSVSTDLQYVGPLPDTICAMVTRDLYGACTSPLSDSYQGTANFLAFGMIFAAISISTGTFGNEQVNYWRESAAGLKTVPYFIAKWIVEFPNIVLASAFFWFAFLIRFPNTGSDSNLFLLFFSMYWWSWSLGFLLSSVAGPDKVFLLGVLVALLLAVAFSGSSPTIDEINDMSPAISWLWSLSGTRWLLEGFYVSQIKYYEEVPAGPLEGGPYMDISAGLDQIGYNVNNFSLCVSGLWLNGMGYGLLAAVIMKFSNRDKKK